MSLSVESRFVGRVCVIKCFGRLVNGVEAQAMESAFTRALQDGNRLVVDTAEVNRVDSTGMGVLVRFLSRIKLQGGDLRLAAPQPFLLRLLQLTKLSSVFRVYDSEEEAILSFLKNPAGSGKNAVPEGPSVLFVDQSPDLCAFVRTLLNKNGYDAMSTCRIHDAKLLLSAGEVAFLVLGPNCSQLPCEEVISTLQPLARDARLVQLEDGFESYDAEQAASELLKRLKSAK